MHFDSIRLCRTGFVAIAAVMISVGPAISEKVGVTAAVNPTVTGQPPGQTVRQLKIGSDVIHNERIRSTSEGSMQLILVDRTTLTISPNSDITINDFVFDRSANSGKLAVTIGKGLMRYVGGQVSHGGEARITTPSASLGIRGGMALINSGNGKTTVIHLYGVVTITTGSNSKTITQPGHYVETSGGQISAPGPAPASLIASYNAQLQSKSGQTAGAKRGHVTADKLNNITNGKNADGSPSERPYQSSVSTQPSPTGLTASSGGISPGGGVGGGGGGGIGGASGPAWGLLTAPGQGNFPAGPPGQALKGIKGGGKP